MLFNLQISNNGIHGNSLMTYCLLYEIQKDDSAGYLPWNGICLMVGKQYLIKTKNL